MTLDPFPAPGSTPIALSARAHEREAERRRDTDWLEKVWDDTTTRVVPLVGHRIPVTEDRSAVRWRGSAGLPDGLRVFLGRVEDVHHFALLLDDQQGDQPADQPGHLGDDPADDPADDRWWSAPRGVLASMGSTDLGLLVHAVALTEWHATHRFCPRCGGRLEPVQAGHVLECEQCGRHQFPRADPAVIMMVTSGDRALLGRQSSWPEGRYSTLAGFVDPGESFEDAVIREVAEEADITVTEVAYFGNQPWPFPASLMIGFFARASTTDITVDGVEIADARWFTREELRSEAEAGTIVLPGGISISRSLIEAWYGGTLPGAW